jgi:hypothetical protein
VAEAEVVVAAAAEVPEACEHASNAIHQPWLHVPPNRFRQINF